MNEKEKKAIEELKSFKKDKDCKYWIGINGEKAIDIIIKLIEKQQKEIKARLKEIDSLYKMMSTKDEEIEELKTITREYEAYKIGEGNKIMIASKEWFNNGYFKENYISKDKIKEYINSPEFLDWNLGFKLIDELEYRKNRINELLGE